MLNITRRHSNDGRPADLKFVPLFQLRNKSRLRATSETGEEVGLILARGSVLRNVDRSLADDGRVIEVVAQAETVSTVQILDRIELPAIDPAGFSRAIRRISSSNCSIEVI